MVALLTLTLASQGLAWDDKQGKDEGNKGKRYAITAVIGAGIVAVVALGAPKFAPKLLDFFKSSKGSVSDAASQLNKSAKETPEQVNTIGIDLGTTISIVGRGDNLLSDLVESAVASHKNGNILVGKEALGHENVLTSVKRVIGRTYDDVKGLDLPFEIIPDEQGMTMIKVGDKIYEPEKISAEVLKHLKKLAEEKLGKPTDKGVITVPAYFNMDQINATKKAAELAGFKETLLIPEPTSAMIAYGADSKTGTRIIFDSGGGTTDVSIVTSIRDSDGRLSHIVKALDGDSMLGGDDFDNRIAKNFLTKFEAEHGKLAADEKQGVWQELLKVAEDSKKALSDVEEFNVETNLLGKYEFKTTITRDEFNAETKDLVKRSKDAVERALTKATQMAQITKDDIDEVLLVGGTSRMPSLQEMLKGIFGEEKLARSLNPETAINPDEAVAKGASLYSRVLDAGGEPTVKLVEIVPESFGIATVRTDGSGEKILERGLFSEIIPYGVDMNDEKVVNGIIENFSLVGGSSNGGKTSINIYQGSDKYVKNNLDLGELEFNVREGCDSIEVCFQLDKDRTLVAKAREAGAGDDEWVETRIVKSDQAQSRGASMKNRGGKDADTVVEEGAEEVDQAAENFDEVDPIKSLLQILGLKEEDTARFLKLMEVFENLEKQGKPIDKIVEELQGIVKSIENQKSELKESIVKDVLDELHKAGVKLE